MFHAEVCIFYTVILPKVLINLNPTPNSALRMEARSMHLLPLQLFSHKEKENLTCIFLPK